MTQMNVHYFSMKVSWFIIFKSFFLGETESNAAYRKARKV